MLGIFHDEGKGSYNYSKILLANAWGWLLLIKLTIANGENQEKLEFHIYYWWEGKHTSSLGNTLAVFY